MTSSEASRLNSNISPRLAFNLSGSPLKVIWRERAILGINVGDDRFPDPTIFNALSDASKDWQVFWQTSYLLGDFHQKVLADPER